MPNIPLAEDAVRPSRTAFWISLALVLATFATYSSVVHFGFLSYDDPSYVIQNLHLRDGVAARNLSWIFLSFSPDNWFPVMRLSLILDYRLFGLNAGWYHAENVLIHALAAVFLFAFLRRATRDIWPSAFVAFVFALHPLHVESVAWVSERKDVLCAFFWFATLWAWLRYTEKPTAGRYAGALVLFALGLMAKPMIVTLPFLLFVLDVWPLQRALSPRLILKKLPEKLPFVALAGAVMWITMQAQQEAFTNVGTLALRMENAVISIGAYIADTFWPARLQALYAYPASLPVWEVIAVAVVLLAFSIYVLSQVTKRPFLAAGWFWFLLTLGPVIGIVQVGGQARADRYMYVPIVGLSIIVAWGLAGLAGRRWALGLGVAACVSCLAMAITTWNQIQYWKDTETLFQHAIDVDARNYLAWDYLGRAVLDKGTFPSEAMSCFRNALAIRPDFAVTHNNLAVVLFQQGKTQEALAEYDEALRLNPAMVIAHVNRANALVGLHQILGAINEYEIALSLDPSAVQAHISLGTLFANGGDIPEGLNHLEEAVRLEPDDKMAQLLLGQMLMQTPGHVSDSIVHFNEALRLDPKYARAHASLANALLQLHGHDQEAIAHLETAQQIEPDPKRAQQLALLKAGGSSGGGTPSDNTATPR